MFLRCAASILATGLVLPPAVAAATGEWGAAWLGGGLALFAALVGLVLFRLLVDPRRPDGGMQRVFGGVVATMLLRLVLLSVGLVVAAKVLGLAPLVFVAGFFSVYAATQFLEIRYIHRARPAPVGAA